MSAVRRLLVVTESFGIEGPASHLIRLLPRLCGMGELTKPLTGPSASGAARQGMLFQHPFGQRREQSYDN